ncbi:hypothetical protein [Krasilnikovia sp. MM14-A1259]|uniref:hypothetical protein n=1 Tax=Krasilnikovia sp. MM14-A1259 TaxID=3373539 RepID=UPI00380AD98D
MSSINAPASSSPPADGRSDFDFLHGSWRVANRRLANPLDPVATTWIEFETIAVARPVLGGLGNTDTYDSIGEVPFHGMTLRLFDPSTCLWRIWWASASRPGHLDSPMEGRFEAGHGVFYGKDVLSGIDVDVRFDWYVDDSNHARWRQAFSTDRRLTWSENFAMDFVRIAEHG